MEYRAKIFDELSPREVYEILKARAAVFVKEQSIIYVDEDDVDYVSLHCFFWEDEIVKAYLRAYPGDEGTIRIGRVLTIEHGRGMGTALMKRAVASVRGKYGCDRICMDAQMRAVPFYERLGFEVTSEPYLEEGIRHVDMELDLRDKEVEY